MNDTCYARCEKRIHHGFAFLFYIYGMGLRDTRGSRQATGAITA